MSRIGPQHHQVNFKEPLRKVSPQAPSPCDKIRVFDMSAESEQYKIEASQEGKVRLKKGNRSIDAALNWNKFHVKLQYCFIGAVGVDGERNCLAPLQERLNREPVISLPVSSTVSEVKSHVEEMVR